MISSRKLVVVAAAMALIAMSIFSASGAQAKTKFVKCNPPKHTAITSLKAKGVGCGKAGKVVTNLNCLNEACTKLGSGKYTCGTKFKGDKRVESCKGPKGRKIVAESVGG